MVIGKIRLHVSAPEASWAANQRDNNVSPRQHKSPGKHGCQRITTHDRGSSRSNLPKDSTSSEPIIFHACSRVATQSRFHYKGKNTLNLFPHWSWRRVLGINGISKIHARFSDLMHSPLEITVIKVGFVAFKGMFSIGLLWKRMHLNGVQPGCWYNGRNGGWI